MAPADWGCDWARVELCTTGYPLKDDASIDQQLDRLKHIRSEAMRFAHAHKVTHAFVLGYAYNMQQVSRAHAAGELGGIVKLGLREMGIHVQVVVESRARTLLGKAPRKDAKRWAVERLMRAGAPSKWTVDELDAFVCMNWGLSELGGDCLILRDQTELPLTAAAARRRPRAAPGSLSPDSATLAGESNGD